eukprot:11732508-Heterocapsa_arctica.AAC.1
MAVETLRRPSPRQPPAERHQPRILRGSRAEVSRGRHPLVLCEFMDRCLYTSTYVYTFLYNKRPIDKTAYTEVGGIYSA